jgi:2-oxoglutarate ferredoxin oxidoreductase subunit alpha
MANFPKLGYDLADKYRNPCMVLADGLLGQMMEPMAFDFDWVDTDKLPPKDYALTGCKGRERRVINTLMMDVNVLEHHTWHLYKKYKEIEANEIRFEERYTDDADIVIVAYGTSARVSIDAITKARSQGIKVGLLRPITLWPFPKKKVLEIASKVGKILTVEMNTGQLVEDVQMSANGKAEIFFYGRAGGVVPTGDEVFEVIKKALSKKAGSDEIEYLNDV